MKKFGIRLLLFFLIVGGMDRAFVVFRYPHTNIFNEIAEKKAAIIVKEIADKKSDYELWFAGSSHLEFGVNPSVFDSAAELGLRSFNLGIGNGTNTGFQYHSLLNLYDFAQAKPKLVIYCLDVFSINQAPSSGMFKDGSTERNVLSLQDRTLSLSQAYTNSVNFKRYGKELFEKGNWQLPIFRETVDDLSMFQKYYGYTIHDNGWVEGKGLLNKSYIRYKDFQFKPDPKATQKLEDVVNWCRSKKVRLVVVQIPEHMSALQYSNKYAQFDAWMAKWTSENKVVYCNFNKAEMFDVGRDDYFFDSDHLNAAGANVFSKALGARVKELVRLGHI